MQTKKVSLEGRREVGLAMLHTWCGQVRTCRLKSRFERWALRVKEQVNHRNTWFMYLFCLCFIIETAHRCLRQSNTYLDSVCSFISTSASCYSSLILLCSENLIYLWLRETISGSLRGKLEASGLKSTVLRMTENAHVVMGSYQTLGECWFLLRSPLPFKVPFSLRFVFIPGMKMESDSKLQGSISL